MTGFFSRSLYGFETAPRSGPPVILQRGRSIHPAFSHFPVVDVAGGGTEAEVRPPAPAGEDDIAGVDVHLHLRDGEVLDLGKDAPSPHAHVLHGLGQVQHPGELGPQIVLPPGPLDDRCCPVGRVSATVTVFQNLHLPLQNLRTKLGLKHTEVTGGEKDGRD